jgi:hypothetical protein
MTQSEFNAKADLVLAFVGGFTACLFVSMLMTELVRVTS